ncbi:hypothetical protein KFE98_14370 [bacterium SCSIO 12741]|nr:hypothetical protein KFE98_14370 [bacterium SCSIO 12741]
MIKLDLKNGLRSVTEVKTETTNGEVILNYIENERGEVLGNVTCTCTCTDPNTGESTSDSASCTQEESKTAVCDCTGSSASISC